MSESAIRLVDGGNGRKVLHMDPDEMFALNPRQKLAYKGALSGKYNEVLFGGGYGGGKSRCLGTLAFRVAMGTENCTVLITRFKLDGLKDNFFPELIKLIPPELMDGKPRFHPKPMITFTNGSRIVGVSGADPNNFRGWNNVKMVGVDEGNEMPESVFPEIMGRFRVTKDSPTLPFLFITTNPCRGYLYDHFVKEDDERLNTTVFIESLAADNGYINTKDYIKNLKGALSEAQFKRNVLGSWEELEGLVFDSYDERIHCVGPNQVIKEEPPENKIYVHAQGMDHGIRNPTVIAFGKVNQDGELYIFDEVWGKGMKPQDIAVAYTEKAKRWNLVGDERVIFSDTSLWGTAYDGFSPAHALSVEVPALLGEEYRIPITQADKHRRGYETIKLLLEKGKLKIAERCVHIRDALATLMYKTETAQQTRYEVYSNDIAPKGKDAVDAVRYMVNGLFPPDVPIAARDYDVTKPLPHMRQPLNKRGKSLLDDGSENEWAGSYPSWF